MRIQTMLLLGLLIYASGCRKKPDPADVPANSSTALMIDIDNVVNGQTLILKDKTYINQNGDSFTVKKYRYYISNLVLETADGQRYTQPESYHLIDQEKAGSKKITIHDLPAGNYVKLSFLVGVDSLRNVSGAQTGALDPLNNMFWDWNQGYIMAMFEGNRPGGDLLVFHITGFRGEYNSLRTVSLALPVPARVKPGAAPAIHLSSDVAEWFKTPVTVDFAKLSAGFAGKEAVTIADNYADMFKVVKVD